MLKSLFTLTSAGLLALSATVAMAQNAPEADSPQGTFTNVDANNGTIILKVSPDGSTSMTNVKGVPANDEQAKAMIANAQFVPVDPSQITKPQVAPGATESDQTSGISSWHQSFYGHGGYRGGYGYGYRGGYYGAGIVYYPPVVNYAPAAIYPTYYNNTGYYDPCYSWSQPVVNSPVYYYYNNAGWNTGWYPNYYYGSRAIAYYSGWNGYGRGGFYHPWRR